MFAEFEEAQWNRCSDESIEEYCRREWGDVGDKYREYRETRACAGFRVLLINETSGCILRP